MNPLNLPLSGLKRDELYTFIVGIFIALSWYLYFQEIGFVSKSNSLDPRLIFAWLFSTGIVWLLSSLFTTFVGLSIAQTIKHQKDDDELIKMGVTKKLSFFWAGPLEEQKVFAHLFTLLTVSLILVFHPVTAYLSANLDVSLNASWFILPCIFYASITVAACLLLMKSVHYLLAVEHFITAGYCDIFD